MIYNPGDYIAPTYNIYGHIDDVIMYFCFQNNLVPQMDCRGENVRFIGINSTTGINIASTENVTPFKTQLFVIDNKKVTSSIITDRKHLYLELMKILKQENELKTG